MKNPTMLPLETLDRPVTVEDEVAALLPFYITGRLGLRDQMIVEQWLDERPASKKALENAYADQQAVIDANETIASPPGALRKLLQDIDEEPLRGWSNYVGGNALSWIMSWLNWIPSRITWGAFAILLALTALQSILLFKQNRDPSTAVSGNPVEMKSKSITAFIRFAPEVGINEVSSLLALVNATIVDGPRGKNTYIIEMKNEDGVASAVSRLDMLSKRTDLVHFIAQKKE